MNIVRKRIINDTEESIRAYPYSEHRDLISFLVSSEEFETPEEISIGGVADFSELIVVVDKDWLFDYMEEESPREYLQEEYTSEDSKDWFDMANITGHLFGIKFN